MRNTAISFTLLLLSAYAAGQVVIVSGYATNAPPPGAYASPFVPRITTPTLNLSTPALHVGASNATEGNVAGATSSPSKSPEVTLFPEPIWYGQTEYVEGFGSEEENQASNEQPLRFGVGMFQSSWGVAQLIDRSAPAHHATRVYTNADVARASAQASQDAGTVKFGGKTEHWN